jgi:hypothetical protein
MDAGCLLPSHDQAVEYGTADEGLRWRSERGERWWTRTEGMQCGNPVLPRRIARRGQLQNDVWCCLSRTRSQSTSAAAAALEMTLLVGRTKPNLDICRLPIFAVTICIAAGLVLRSTTTTYYLEQYAITRQSGASLSIEPRRRNPKVAFMRPIERPWPCISPSIKRPRYMSHCTTSVSLTST